MPEVRILGAAAMSMLRRSAPTRRPSSLAIAVTTGRAEPRLDWLADGLEAQAIPGDRIELIVVDARGRDASEMGFRSIPQVTRVVSSRPKPCVWQGSQRLTSRDYWAASSARNTAIVLCDSAYVAFLDDCCHLGPGWLDRVRAGERDRSSVLVGPYDRRDGAVVDLDHRLQVRPRGWRGCGGGWLYGGNFALPLAWLYEVNGFEEGVDGLAGEDYLLGHMLTNAGRRVDFCADMYVYKERRQGAHHPFPGADRDRTPGDKARAAFARFGARRRTEFTPDLAEIRRRVQAGLGFPDVDPSTDPRDWYDGARIRDL